MREKRLHFKNLAFFFLAPSLLLFLGTPVRAQSAPTQANKPTEDAQDNDTTRNEPARFDRFLESHREIAEQLRKDPSLVNNKEFVDKHPALQTYLQEHEGIREEAKENPSAFMRREDRFDGHEEGRDSDASRKEMAQFDRFLDGHRETAEQLRKDPSLVNNKEFVQKHPALQTYLQDHPGIREDMGQNPNAFMRQEVRYDRHEDVRDSDTARRDNDGARPDNDNVARRDNDNGQRDNDSARRDNDSARRDNDNVARQDNDNGQRDNDSARRDNDGARRDNDDVARRDNDNGQRDNDTARRDNDSVRHDNDEIARRDDNDATHKGTARFDQFADSHREIAEQLRKDPSLVNNRAFVDQHPALQAYMQEHPEIRDQINDNPNAFMRQDDRFDQHEHDRDSYTTRGHAASFGQFLGGHSIVAQQVTKDPTLVKNDNYLKSHPELQEYFNSHPGVREEMQQNPQSFIKSAGQFNTNNNNGAATKTIPAPTGATTKPKL